jgi:hypothetical protein
MYLMDWKSTAVISGAGILATWFFSMPAVQSPSTGTIAPAASPAQATASAIDIQREADRLQVRVHQQPQYVETSRNPFRFGARPAPAAGPSATSGPAAAPVIVPQPPPPPRITLDGIATDVVDGREQRTAMLKTDAGIVLVREGEEVAGQFRVGKIATDAVELVKISDGSVLRLALR